MFIQMCDAVEACHRVGISHRDIKPENFICIDDRGHIGERKVVVKITDWGLGTQEEECGDFDCGSKPYMAYECRNNVSPNYRPREADVWSLGIVLLNLLFHRCPWADPTPDDDDFCQFREAPVNFLEDRFRGIGPEVARFLAHRVFAPNPADRVTAGEFGAWANRLVRLMGEGLQKGSASENTFPIIATAHRASPIPSPRLAPISVDRASSRRRGGSKLAPPAADPLSPAENGHPVDAGVNGLRAEATDLDANDDDKDSGDEASVSAHVPSSTTKSKRRKRGARKGKSNRDKDKEQSERDVLNAALAEASQSLARELSHSARSPSPTILNKKLSKPSLIDRMKGALRNGNPDLEAFMQRVKERDAIYGAAGAESAPAKLGGHSSSSSLSDGRSHGPSRATVSVSDKGRHWESASDRRGRLDQKRKVGSSSASPLSSMSSNEGTVSTTYSSSTSATSAWSSSKRPSPHPSETAPCWRVPLPTAEDFSTSSATKKASLDAIAEQHAPPVKLGRSNSRGSMGSTRTNGTTGKKKLARMLGFNRDTCID
jgi:serine/threonine protein kinase